MKRRERILVHRFEWYIQQSNDHKSIGTNLNTNV